MTWSDSAESVRKAYRKFQINGVRYRETYLLLVNSDRSGGNILSELQRTRIIGVLASRWISGRAVRLNVNIGQYR